MSNWRKAIQNLSFETGYRPLSYTGTIPEDLRGILYRNGPALFTLFGRKYGHPFDADGAVSAVRFSENNIEGAIRVVLNDGLKKERQAGKPLYGGWGTPVPGWLRGFQGGTKNPANISVFFYQNRLFALFDAGLPTELSLQDLSTLGSENFDGLLSQAFSAHPHWSPRAKAYFNFGVRYHLFSYLDLYRFPIQGRPEKYGRVMLPGATVVHDFIIAGDYLVFVISPLRINLYTTAFGRRPMQESFAWDPTLKTEVVLVDQLNPVRQIRIEAPPFHVWHFANGFEEGKRLIIDFIRYPDFTTSAWFAGLLQEIDNPPSQAELWRMTIDPGQRRLDFDRLWEASVEFPMIDRRAIGQKYRYLYLAAHGDAEAARGWWNRLAKFDLEQARAQFFSLAEGMYPSEPVFVGKKGQAREDDGYILAHIYDVKTDQTLVCGWDGLHPETPPLFTACFGAPLPFTFHGLWVD